MSEVRIDWKPKGFDLDSLGRKRYLGPPADGDTPYLRVPVRMLSIDTPETNYPGIGKPTNSNRPLRQLARWIVQGRAPVDDDLAAYLVPRLATGLAGTLQYRQGQAAKGKLKEFVSQRLARPNGAPRDMFVRTGDEVFDANGRLLAYLAPAYTKAELKTIRFEQRKTFNLLMVESGWAATLVIFPSLPKHSDLVLLHAAARNAVQDRLGAWAEPLLLTGYEWRMCVKLHAVTKQLVRGKTLSRTERQSWISRHCADMTTLELYQPQQYHKVPPYNRLFIWPADKTRAVRELKLLPAGGAGR